MCLPGESEIEVIVREGSIDAVADTSQTTYAPSALYDGGDGGACWTSHNAIFRTDASSSRGFRQEHHLFRCTRDDDDIRCACCI